MQISLDVGEVESCNMAQMCSTLGTMNKCIGVSVCL